MLKQNGYRDSLGSTAFFGAGTTNGAYPYITGANSRLSGAQRNIFAGEAGIDPKSSIPAGARPPQSWQMAQKDGGMASHSRATVSADQTANAVMGLPGQGSATVQFIVSDATGGLIVSGSGSTSLSLSVSGTILSIASGQGSASVTLSAPDATIGAEAGIQGSAAVVMTPVALITARGYMQGLSTSETEFSAAALANAVWQAEAVLYGTAGTMGEKLNDAGSASNPWTELIEAGFTASEILKAIAAVLLGEVSGAGTGTETFKGLDGTTDRVTSTVDSSGNRTSVVVDGS